MRTERSSHFHQLFKYTIAVATIPDIRYLYNNALAPCYWRIVNAVSIVILFKKGNILRSELEI